MTLGNRRNSPRVEALRIELLKRQSEALLLVKEHHLRWMNETDDPKIRALYYSVAQSLEQTLYQYDDFLEVLETRKNKG